MEDLLTYLLTPAAQIALVIGLAEVFKRTGFPKRFIPILDLTLGILSGVFVYGVFLNQGIFAGVILGIGIGLSACGTFSGIKNLFGEHEPPDLFEEDDDDEGN